MGEVLVHLDKHLVIVVHELLQLEEPSIKVLGKEVEQGTHGINNLNVVVGVRRWLVLLLRLQIN